MGKKESKEQCILNIFLQPCRRISANPLTDSMFKCVFLRYITARLPWVLYSNELIIHSVGKNKREWEMNMESFPHQVSPQGFAASLSPDPSFSPAENLGCEQTPTLWRLYWWQMFIPSCSSPSAAEVSAPSEQLPAVPSNQNQNHFSQTKQISTDLPLNTVRKMPMKAGNTSPALPPAIHSSSPSCKQQHLTDPFRHHRMLNRQIMIFLLNRRKSRRGKVGKPSSVASFVSSELK